MKKVIQSEKQLYLDAAENIAKKLKSPLQLSEFLKEVAYHCHGYSIKNSITDLNKTPAFLIWLLTQHILEPWIEGGEKPITNIAAGLEEIGDFVGHESYHSDMMKILRIWSDNESSVTIQQHHLKENLIIFEVLFNVGYAIEQMEQIEESKTEQAA